MSSALYEAPKSSLPTLAAIIDDLFCLAKIIFFRSLIKYLAHNHPHITTIFARELYVK